MAEAENYSKIEKLKKNLYRRQDQAPSRRSKLSAYDDRGIKKTWTDEPESKANGLAKYFVKR